MRSGISRLEVPKTLIASDDSHLPRRGPLGAAATGQCRLEQNRRLSNDSNLWPLRIAIGRHLVSQRRAKEPRRDEHGIDPAEPIKREMPQAAANRIADQQRAGQHCRGGHHPERHGHVDPAVKGEAALG